MWCGMLFIYVYMLLILCLSNVVTNNSKFLCKTIFMFMLFNTLTYFIKAKHAEIQTVIN